MLILRKDLSFAFIIAATAALFLTVSEPLAGEGMASRADPHDSLGTPNAGMMSVSETIVGYCEQEGDSPLRREFSGTQQGFSVHPKGAQSIQLRLEWNATSPSTSELEFQLQPRSFGRPARIPDAPAVNGTSPIFWEINSGALSGGSQLWTVWPFLRVVCESEGHFEVSGTQFEISVSVTYR